MKSDNGAQEDRMEAEMLNRRGHFPNYDRSTNEQDRFIKHCIDHQTFVTVILESGMAFQGLIIAHDRKSLLLGPLRDTKNQRLFVKSYISLIRAGELLPLFLEYKGLGNYLTRKKERRNLIRKAKETREYTPRVQRQLRKPKPAPAIDESPAPAAPAKETVIITRRSRRNSIQHPLAE